MADAKLTRPMHEGRPLYSIGAAPRYMFTERQLREQFDLRPGSARCRAFVDSQYGPAALYLITEAEVINPRPELAD